MPRSVLNFTDVEGLLYVEGSLSIAFLACDIFKKFEDSRSSTVILTPVLSMPLSKRLHDNTMVSASAIIIMALWMDVSRRILLAIFLIFCVQPELRGTRVEMHVDSVAHSKPHGHTHDCWQDVGAEASGNAMPTVTTSQSRQSQPRDAFGRFAKLDTSACKLASH
ncbi:hypothetical protein BC835DRAFT_1306671 [Cytidiella melzeri]|nr:hypothetical protein BC835DRAFT_1306671 [Cytidiella melzeri]